MVVYALLGTSRPLSVSTTTTIAILTAAELGRAAPGGDAATPDRRGGHAVGAGRRSCSRSASLLRLGFIANFISDPVLTGFKSGIGLVIVVDQLPKLLGVHFEKTGFFRDLIALAQQLPETSIPTLLLGVALLALLVALEHFAPRAPAPLVAIATGDRRVRRCWVSRRWASPRWAPVAGGLPTPDAAASRLWSNQMWPAAAGIALMSFTETHCRGARLRCRGRAAARSQPGTAGPRLGQCRRWPARGDAGGRRHVADRRQSPGRRAHPGVGARHRHDGPGDAPAARAGDRAHAAGGARRRRRRSTRSS